jgi:NgoFVII-like restriction endonuclease
MKLLCTPTTIAAEFQRLMNRYKRYDWAVAWASVNFDSFQLLRKHRQKIKHVVIGTEFHQTHPDFIAEFAGDTNVRFRIDREGLTGLFHPKIYLFSNSDSCWEAVIGSVNFTRAAFTENIECAVLLGSTDQTDRLTYAELLHQIKTMWDAATHVTTEKLAAYRTRWEINRARLGAAGGYTSNKVRAESVYDCELLTWDWPQFFKRVRREPGNRFQDRLKLLEQTHAIFNVSQSLERMTLSERKRICGTAVDEDIKWRLFGSMAGSIVLKKRIADNDRALSRALDAIPLSGPVTKEHYDIYIARLRRTFVYDKGFQGLAVATRPLCIKRPDYFICIDGKNKSGLAKALGLKKTKIGIDTYWDAVIAPILDSRWNLASPPARAAEKRAWNARVAMVDALFYDPH